MASRHFRAGVIVAVRDDDGRVLAFERVDAPGQWQLPQGGIHRAEQPVDAAWRELAEETGLGPDEVELVGEHPGWVLAEWPADVVGDGDRLGQIHRWFFFRVRDGSVEPTPDGREFGDWRWVEPSWLLDQVVPFRRPGYSAVLGHE